MTESKLVTRKEAITKEFDTLRAARGQIVEDGKKLQTRLNEIDRRLMQLQGSYQEIENLLGESKEPKKVPEKESKAIPEKK